MPPDRLVFVLPSGIEKVVVLASLHLRTAKPAAVFEAFHRVQGEHRMTESCVQFVKDGFPQAPVARFAVTQVMVPPIGIALLFDLCDLVDHLFRRSPDPGNAPYSTQFFQSRGPGRAFP